MFNYSNITTIYVSQKYGQDYFGGFYKEPTENLQGPVKTIEQALKKAGELRKRGANQPLSIVITDDIYFTDKPIVIDSSVNSVTIKSLKHTVISGGFQIKGFKNDVFNNQKCFSANVPEIDKGVWFTDLYVDNKRANFTSYPKEGLLKAKSVENESTDLHESSKWFIANPQDISDFKNFRNFGDCFISYNHYWVDEHTPIESYDLETGKIVFKYSSRFTISLAQPHSALEYKIENVAEAFCNKNEWYLDRTTKKVYYIPRNDEQTTENIEVFAPLTDKIFIIENTKNIYFENLTFAYTKGDYKSLYQKLEGDNVYKKAENAEGFSSDIQSVCWAHGTIEFFHSNNCEIRNCTLKNLGVHAVTVNEGCYKIRILNNLIFDTGAGGIKVNGGEYGCEKSEETHNITISDNIINDLGNRYFAGCGILIMHAYENTVSHNTIFDLYYSGISVGWVWGYKDSITRDNLIEKNYIHHVGQGKLSDMGGIYILGKQPGTIVRNNVIHDVISKHYGGWGLYADEGSSYVIFEKNICYNLTSNAFQQHYGQMNTVRNNIFAKSGFEPVHVSRNELHINILCEKNIIVSDSQPSYSVGYTHLEAGGMQVIAGNNNLHYNFSGETYITKILDKTYTLEESKNIFGIETGSIIANPLFKDYQNNDFSLSENSPAFDLGFEAIDVSDVGARKI